MCYTLEMSFYGVSSRGGGSAPRWSPWGSNDEQYRAFGVGLAYSFLDYYGIRRDAESEAVTARVFNAAATGEHAAPERAFGNSSAAAEKTELFAAYATARPARTRHQAMRRTLFFPKNRPSHRKTVAPRACRRASREESVLVSREQV